MKENPSSQAESIRVLIVDDHIVVRQGLRTFLELHDDLFSDERTPIKIEVVGEAANGLEAVDLARSLAPDIVLLDLVMPKMGGVEATSKIREHSPQTRVLILTSFGEQEKVIPAIKAGAQGYLLKDIAPDDLARAIRETYRGQVQLHPEVAKKLMSAIADQGESPASQSVPPALANLTKREIEVLGLLSDGLPNREIAATLVISEKTVKTHVSNILSKLNLDDRTQAAIFALRHGLVSDEG